MGTSEYHKAYYEANKSELLARQRERNAKNYQLNRDAYRAKTKAWQEANPERAKQLQQEYRERNKARLNASRKASYEANRESELLQRRASKIKSYGITPDQFEVMLKEQGGTCAICHTDKPTLNGKGSFRIDHCHTTGKVRGLLCNKCNAGLGMFSDKIEMLNRAIAYLTKSSSGAT